MFFLFLVFLSFPVPFVSPSIFPASLRWARLTPQKSRPHCLVPVSESPTSLALSKSDPTKPEGEAPPDLFFCIGYGTRTLHESFQSDFFLHGFAVRGVGDRPFPSLRERTARQSVGFRAPHSRDVRQSTRLAWESTEYRNSKHHYPNRRSHDDRDSSPGPSGN